MSIKVALEHRTTYRFDRPIEHRAARDPTAPRPALPDPDRRLLADHLARPNHFLNWQQDPFGNYVARVVFPKPATALEITVGLVADMETINPFDFFVEDYAETFPFRYPDALASELAPYLAHTDRAEPAAMELDPVVSAVAGRTRARGHAPTVDFLVALNSAVYEDVGYSARMEPGVQSPDETLTRDRLVPGLGLVAGRRVAALRSRGPVRLRLPGAAG